MKNWILKHPNLSAWFVLAIGMMIILAVTARDVGLLPLQWFWLMVITVLVAGACIWIISWGDDDLAEDPPAETLSAESEPAAEDA